MYDVETRLIKMVGRIEYANIMDDEKHSIILPSQSYAVKLIVEDIHRRQLHAGINQTLICVRDKYWMQYSDLVEEEKHPIIMTSLKKNHEVHLKIWRAHI